MRESLIICDTFPMPEGGPPERIRIPFGTWVHPKEGEFTVNEDNARQMADNFACLGIDVVIDYEHQTLSGAEAPAAGWVKGLAAEADGLYAAVEWTDKARDRIAAKEYRYWSPTFDFRAKAPRTGERIGAILHSVALTNTPLLAGDIEPLAAKYVSANPPQNRSSEMELNELLQRLGMPENTTEEAALAALDTRLAGDTDESAVAACKAVCAALGLPEDATEEQLTAAITACKAEPETKDESETDELQKRIATLEGTLARRGAETAVDAAIAACKVSPAQRDWAVGYAARDPEEFAAFVKGAQPLIAAKSAAPAGDGERELTEADLTDEDREVCALFHTDAAEFAACKAKLSA